MGMLTKLPESYTENTNYSYAVGRVRALETKLLDRGKIERLVKAEDTQEISRILTDSDYAHIVSDLTSRDMYNKALQLSRETSYKIVDELIIEEKVRNTVHIPFDYFNLKVMLKSKVFERDFSEILSPLGIIQIDMLKDIFQGERYDTLPGFMTQAIFSTVEAFYINKDPQIIDFMFDSLLMAYLSENGYPPFLRDYYKMKIDLVNFRTVLRVKIVGGKKEMIRNSLIKGGFVEFETMIDLINENPENIPQRFVRWIYFDSLSEGIKYLVNENSFVKYEYLMEKFLLNYVYKANRLVFGSEPIVGYLLKKENEIKNLRVILSGKFNRIPEEKIIERVVI